MRGATSLRAAPGRKKAYFNPRSSCEERHKPRRSFPFPYQYFNPRSSCEERHGPGFLSVPWPYFNPRSSCEERPYPLLLLFALSSDFNPRSSCEERPEGHPKSRVHTFDFNPRSSCEERLYCKLFCDIVAEFQSTLLMRGATIHDRLTAAALELFQSTLLMRGATRTQCSLPDWFPRISIHAPHARSDAILALVVRQAISIHAPHARSDQGTPDGHHRIFISIHAPHARSDPHAIQVLQQGLPISIHAPHARSDDGSGVGAGRGSGISIHAPHARSDIATAAARIAFAISIHAPHARSDAVLFAHVEGLAISIHAPHARSDEWDARRDIVRNDISIHAPHARSDDNKNLSVMILQFQSTLLMRGATSSKPFIWYDLRNFNPRSSCEERR